ncbi:hypothetical protein Pla175_30550 [Pirellulimonas nuda]|uniref:Uncharacterized protein n=1 Tax=Pirellulimonas nuda TaxID=2528009 RepID=A0A518DDV5_9BACT|nr:hypothetical protein Pla175_30550 [Pirellulimonas nuda]
MAKAASAPANPANKVTDRWRCNESPVRRGGVTLGFCGRVPNTWGHDDGERRSPPCNTRRTAAETRLAIRETALSQRTSRRERQCLGQPRFRDGCEGSVGRVGRATLLVQGRLPDQWDANRIRYLT